MTDRLDLDALADWTVVEFDVPGRPAPQGNHTPYVDATGRARLLEGRNRGQRERHADWREAVAQSAWVAMAQAKRTTPILGPVEVQVVFRLQAPKSLKTGVRLHHRRPDVDKLVRSTLDAIQVGGVYGDDAQVAHLDVWKLYALPGEPTGARVRVAALDPTDDSHTPPFSSLTPFSSGAARP